MYRTIRFVALLAIASLTAPSLANAQISGAQIAPLEPIDIPTIARDVSTYYPDRAQRMQIGGQAVLDCQANDDRTISDCKLVSEYPQGWDFGAAALKIAKAQLAPWSGKIGGRVTVPVHFEPTDASTVPRLPVPVSRGPARRLAGQPSVPASRIKPGETIVSEPFAFNRTAVLTNEVVGKTWRVKGLRIPAGSLGFYAGSFGKNASRQVPTWCLIYAASKGRMKRNCLMLYDNATVVVPGAINIYGFSSFSVPVLGPTDYASTPAFEEKPIDIPGDLRLDYRFRRWGKSWAEIDVWANGEIADFQTAPKGADGRALLQTLGGGYWLSQPADDPKTAIVERASSFAP